MPRPTDDNAISGAWFAWLAKKLIPYLAPLIAAEVARQIAAQQPPPPDREPERRYIGE